MTHFTLLCLSVCVGPYGFARNFLFDPTHKRGCTFSGETTLPIREHFNKYISTDMIMYFKIPMLGKK